MANGLSLHETIEIHELLNFTTLRLTKSKLIQGVVFDKELKTLLIKDVQQSRQGVFTLWNLLKNTALH